MPKVPDWYARLYTPEERLAQLEGALEAIWNKLSSLGWSYRIGPANWIEQALAWIEERAERAQNAQSHGVNLLPRWADYVHRLESESPRCCEPENWGWCPVCYRLVPTAAAGAPCPVCETVLKLSPGPDATARPHGIADPDAEFELGAYHPPSPKPITPGEVGAETVAMGVRASKYAWDVAHEAAEGLVPEDVRRAYVEGWNDRRANYGYDEGAVEALLGHIDANPLEPDGDDARVRPGESNADLANWLGKLNRLAKAVRK